MELKSCLKEVCSSFSFFISFSEWSHHNFSCLIRVWFLSWLLFSRFVISVVDNPFRICVWHIHQRCLWISCDICPTHNAIFFYASKRMHTGSPTVPWLSTTKAANEAGVSSWTTTLSAFSTLSLSLSLSLYLSLFLYLFLWHHLAFLKARINRGKSLIKLDKQTYIYRTIRI